MSLLAEMNAGTLEGDTALMAHALLQPMRTPFALLNTDGVILDISESWAVHSDSWALAEEVRGAGVNYLDFLASCTGSHAKHATRLADGLRGVLRRESTSFVCEYPGGGAGTPGWYEFWATAFSDPVVPGVLVSHIDISRQRTEAQQLSIHRAMHEAAPCPTIVTNRAGTIEWVNPAFCAHTGYTLEEAIGRTPGSLLNSSQQDPGFYKTMWSTIQAGKEWRGRITNRRKDGGLSVEDMRILPINNEAGEPTHFLAVKEDLTKYLDALRQVHEKNEQYRGLFENNVATMLLIDPESGSILNANPAATKFYGWSREKLLSMHIAQINTLSPKQIRHEMEAAKREERNYFRFRHRRAGGDVRDVEVFSVPITHGGQRLLYSIVHDVTEALFAENRIHHLNLVLRAVRDVNQLIVRERNPQRIIQMTCQILVRHRGYIAAVLVRTDPDGTPEDWAFAGNPGVYGPIHSLLAEGCLPDCCGTAIASCCNAVVECPTSATCKIDWPGTMSQDCQNLCVALTHNQTSYGTLIVSLDRALAAEQEERSLLVAMAGDIAYALHVHQLEQARAAAESQQEALEQQLIMAQKLESIGKLAGGVAHDFNNMLGVIRGYAEMGLDAIEEGHPLYTNLKEIHNAAMRSCDITRQLLAFARKQTIEPRAVNLNETIESMLKILRRLIGEEIALTWVPGNELWTVRMDPAQMDQIMANLCVNARDAIGGVGSIRIGTRNVHLDSECLLHDGMEGTEFVEVSVADTGEGMDDETKKMIFDPFFTTKELGQGTGLGLATTYGIMKQNHGIVDVKSAQGQGTTMYLYFPRHGGDTDEVNDGSMGALPRGQGETVLLVEDEISFRVATEMMLERLGYRVLTVASPLDALDTMNQHDGRIDLLLTDVVMPHMDGRALANQLQAATEGLRVLFMSGYTADIIGERGILDEGILFVQKPFSFDILARKVREALSK